MKRYDCPNAFRDCDDIMCRKVSGPCGNVKFCTMSGRTELTEFAVKCPVRFQEDKPKKGRGKKK